MHLSAFHYDKAWKVRSWGNNREPGVVIDITGMEEGWTITFIYTIDRFKGNEFKQIAVWWRERHSKTRETKEAVELYSVENGLEVTHKVKAKTELRKLKRKLCNTPALVSKGQDTALCASFRSR